MADSLSRSVLSLFECLRSKSPSRGATAAHVASDLYSLCVESVSATELAYCSAVLFDKESGILKFLKDSASLEEFTRAKEELLQLLDGYIKILKEKTLPYVVEIKKVCFTLFSRDKTSRVKNAIFPPLIAALELCARSPVVESLNIPKLSERFLQACQQHTKQTSTVRGSLFEALGRLCELFPEFMVAHSKRLIGVYMKVLKSEMSSKKPELLVIAGCLKGLCSYLVNFSQSVAEGSAYACDIYKFTRKAIDPSFPSNRYAVPRAGLLLIFKHAVQFREYLTKDHKCVYSCILDWCSGNNKENKNNAFLALESFFKQVSAHLVENAAKDRESNAAIFKEFIQNFRAIIDSKESGHKELAVAIKGYGFFAAPCKIFMKAQDVQFMFSEMVQRSEQLFFSPVTDTSDDRLFHLPSFLEALAAIVKEMDELSESFLLSLEKLMVLLFECFPHIPANKQTPTAYAVMRMIMGIATNRTALKKFLSYIVYQGLLRTCSHPPVLEVGDDGSVFVPPEETDVLGQTRPSYHDYVQLWMEMMDPTKLKSLSLEFHDSAMRQTVHQIVYDEVVTAVLKIVHRLDLSSKSDQHTEDETSEAPVPDEPSLEVATSDPISGLQPSVPKDFQIFINLVDLCKALFPRMQAKMFEHWVYTFGREVIVQSSSHPLVSGFYKLLGMCLKMCKKLGYFQGVSVCEGPDGGETAMETDVSDKQACFVLFQKFIKEVLVRMKQYKDDLLASCLHLLLCLPKELVEHELEALVPALQTTFKLGLGYLPLASSGLDALEAWSVQLPPALLYPHLKHILPCLDEYLKTEASDVQSEAGTVMVQSRSTRGKKMPVKIISQWKEGIEGAEKLQHQIRKRVVHFLGSLGGQVSSTLVQSESAAAYAARAVAWDSRPRLEVALPFQDMKPTLYLDCFLPRVCELATSSSDRQTKIAACELLHALVLFTIGRSAQPAMQKMSPMTNLYRKLFPFILQLGCDVERVTQQLFGPLVFQMIHWFTRNTQYESPDTIALLDAILDGIVSTDTALRDFCALCVKEFLVWSIKQASKKQQEKSPVNTKSLLKRLYSLASHPSAAKRLGAALAINSIYTVFREEKSLVDMFVIEMLVVVINSLRMAHVDGKSLGTQEQASQAIAHLARIIRAKADILSRPSKTRRKPKSLAGADLDRLVTWLLQQCGSPETECRQQCISLFKQFSPLQKKVLNARMWIRKTIECEGGLYFVNRFEMAGKNRGVIQRPVLVGPVFSLSETVSWLEELAAALDCYNWVFQEQLMSPSEVFQVALKSANYKQSHLFQSLNFFVSTLSLHGIEAAARCFDSQYSSVYTPREVEEYNNVKCTVILKLLRFLSVLLKFYPQEAFDPIPESFWSETLFKVVTACTLRPTSIGFNTGDVDVMEQLPKEVLDSLQVIEKCLPPALKSSFMSCVNSETSPTSACNLISHLPLRLHANQEHVMDYRHLKSTISGYLLLQKAGMLLTSLQPLKAENIVPKLLDSVFGTVKPLVTGLSDPGQNILSPASEEIVGLLLELALEIGIPPVDLVNCILDYAGDCPGLGLMVYQCFPQLLNSFFLANHQPVVALLVDNSTRKPETVSTVLLGLLDHVSRDRQLKQQHGCELSSCLLGQWSQLRSWWEGQQSELRPNAINLLRKVLSIEQKLLVQASAEDLEPVMAMYLALIEDTSTSLAFKEKVLDVFQYFATLPSEQLQRLRKSLNKLIANQFPLKSTEFPAGTPQFNEYISVVDKMLHAMVVSGSMLLLEVLISIMCREERHAHEEQIQDSLAQFIVELPEGEGKAAVDVAYGVFTDGQRYSPQARRAALERVCLPLLRACSLVPLREFFLDHIMEIMGIIEADLSKHNLESQLVSKLCCFQLLEVLYSRLPVGAVSSADSSINTAYCRGHSKTGKEMTQAATKAGHVAKSEDLHGDQSHAELRRQYHCMAYNMLVAVISCTQSKVQFYNGFLFKEDPTKGQFLWDNLVSSDRVYEFPIELEKPIDRKTQMTTIRDELSAHSSRESSPTDSPTFPVHYLSSQYLADSSLSTDISQFDFSGGSQSFPAIKIREAKAKQETWYVVSEEQVEQDALNTHESMLALMRLLDHMEHNNINPAVPKGTVPDEMPAWMAGMHKKITDARTHQNIKLFIIKLITNRPKVFQPYAKYWLCGLAQFVIGGHCGAGMNYFVVDVVVTMLSWSATATLEDQYLASRLLEHLMEHCHCDNKSVFRNNLEIIKALTECWRDRLQTPTRVIFNHFCSGNTDSKADVAGIQLLGIVVANRMQPYDHTTAGNIDEKVFYKKFVSLMCYKYKDVHAAAAEVVGLILSYMAERDHMSLGNLHDLVAETLLKLVSEQAEYKLDKFLTCLHKIQQGYPKITERFTDKLLFLLPRFHGIFRSMCLEVLHGQADIRPQLYTELRHIGFHDMLAHRDEPIQLAALNLVQGMVQHLDEEQTRTVLPFITKFGSHSSPQCRVLMYDILISIYNIRRPVEGQSPADETTKKLLSDVKDQLLHGLADDAEDIRLKMYGFWNEESRLASDTLGRLTQLLAVLYSTSTEHQFLFHSTNLMLELTSRSPDYNRTMFDSPLSECKFEDYTGIDLSWQQRHLQMTPLFAATLASQPGQTLADTGTLGSVQLRATQQSLAFTPTQEGISYNWMTPSLQTQDSVTFGSVGSTPDSSLLFAVPKLRPPRKSLKVVGEDFGTARLKPDDTTPRGDSEGDQRSEIMKLKRRFLRDRSVTTAHYAKVGARKKSMRDDVRRRQRAARDNRVVMYRKYRVGELPDIQIKYSELIRPFQALAQRDSSLARSLFASLYTSVFAQIDEMLDVRGAESTKKAVQDGLNAVMEASTQYHRPFIGSLLDLCFREKELKLLPAAVSTACLISKQDPIGVMLLEKQLLHAGDAEEPRPAKRARRAVAMAPEGTETWVELARLYKSLGDYDVLCGIFSSLDGTKDVTKHALEAEERADYVEALRHYKQAQSFSAEDWLDGPPLQAEEDLWDDSILACYGRLTEWQDLEQIVTLNIDDCKPPSLDKIWEDSYYQEHYLPHVMRSKLKLACSGLSEDEDFTRFLERALQDADKKSLLESRYCTELALYSIFQGNLDKAKYYTGSCVQLFLQDWSNLDSLLVKSRADRLQGLQCLAEMEEYLDFMGNSANFQSTRSVDQLLHKWQGRFPHPKQDPISVWDDIITGRCMMMRKILQRFHTAGPPTSSADSMEVDGALASFDLTALQRKFSREYTNLYLKIAHSARLQSNYPVATKYLKLTESALNEHFPQDIELQVEWLHNVAELTIQQAVQDPSPAKIEPLVTVVHRLEAYSSETPLTRNCALSRSHHLLLGSAYNQLASSFTEEGQLVLDVLQDSSVEQLRSTIGVPAPEQLTPAAVAHHLLKHSLHSYKEGVKYGTSEHKTSSACEGMVSALVQLAAFCNKALQLKEDDDIDSPLDTAQFPSVVVAYLLKAMKYGSSSAMQSFPRLLQIVELYPSTMKNFKDKSAEVPSWMFIGWISQLVALLDKEEGPAVHGILLSIGSDYPQALCYPFKISSGNFKFSENATGRANQEAFKKLKKKVDIKLVNEFVAALEQLSSPELVLKDFMENDIRPLMDQTNRDVEKLKQLAEKFIAQLKEWNMGTSVSLYGSSSSASLEVGTRQKLFAKDYVRKIEEKFGNDGSKLAAMPLQDFNRFFGKLNEDMKPGLSKATGASLLKDYSPWLNTFQEDHHSQSIEIPGQYDGKSKPLPEYHVKISGFDEKVLVMTSLRKPKRITIRGNDEREHMFLVKGGEDLRLDQRVEQLFGVMNEVLREDAACSQRALSLRTYQVIPMTPRVGLIEWMKNTKPLKSFIQDALADDNERKTYNNAAAKQHKWLTKYEGRNINETYKNMYKKAKREEVVKEYKAKIACVPWNLLKRAFEQLSSSPEAFLTLRSHFTRTLATVNMCQYVISIGDRHLSNFMVDMDSGGIIGIDFGHAFGTATQFLPIPELVPFRLTPQLTNLLQPHSSCGQLKSCMVHTLRALRNSPDVLLNTMDVFVKEPSLDWKSYARRQARAQKLNKETFSQEGTWYPKQKLKQARKKLLGYNSAFVMRTDLEQGHGKSPEYNALHAMLMGDRKNIRAQVGEKCSSVEEQVTVLMDHATDLNILGRTYAGWEPWV